MQTFSSHGRGLKVKIVLAYNLLRWRTEVNVVLPSNEGVVPGRSKSELRRDEGEVRGFNEFPRAFIPRNVI